MVGELRLEEFEKLLVISWAESTSYSAWLWLVTAVMDLLSEDLGGWKMLDDWVEIIRFSSRKSPVKGLCTGC